MFTKDLQSWWTESGCWLLLGCPKTVRSGNACRSLGKVRMETAMEAKSSSRSHSKWVAELWPEVQAKGAVCFWEGWVGVQVPSKTLLTANSGYSGFIQVLVISPKIFSWKMARSWFFFRTNGWAGLLWTVLECQNTMTADYVFSIIEHTVLCLVV